MSSSSSNHVPGTDPAQWWVEQARPIEPALRGYLRRQFPSVEADDVIQESYLRVWRARAAQPIRSAKALLFQIARRLALDLVRRHRRAPFVPVKDFAGLFVYDPGPDAADAASTADELALLVDAIDRLPARCREIFILCHVEGLSQREVAVRLGISENTVAVQAARGLRRCEAFVRKMSRK